MSSEPPGRVRFPRTHTRRFYSCMCCSNHILDVPRPRNNRNPVLRAGRIVFCYARQTVNVWFDSLENSRLRDGRPVVSVYCNQCNQPIGEKFITEGQAYDEPVHLYRKSLLFWDGEFTIYSDTLEVADVDND